MKKFIVVNALPELNLVPEDVLEVITTKKGFNRYVCKEKKVSIKMKPFLNFILSGDITEKKPFVPVNGSRWWYVDRNYRVASSTGNILSSPETFEVGNVFKTERQAQQALEIILQVFSKLREI